MDKERVTAHAMIRLTQRGFHPDDLEWISLIGTKVEGGYFVRRKDWQPIARVFKQIVTHFQGLDGARIVFPRMEPR